MPSTSIENETNVLTAPQDLSTLFAPFWKSGGSPENAAMNMAEVLKSAKNIVITGGTQTANSALMTSSVTWDNSLVTFTGYTYNFTITGVSAVNAAAASYLFSYVLNGSPALTLTRYGDLQGLSWTATGFEARLNNGGLLLGQSATIKWGAQASAAGPAWDIGLDRLAANVMEVTDASTGRGSLAAKSVESGTFVITDAADYELNPRNGYFQSWVLGANRTPRGTNFLAGQQMILMIDDGSAFGVTWTHASLNVVWIGGSPPALPTSGYAIIKLFKVGSTVYGKHEGNAA